MLLGMTKLLEQKFYLLYNYIYLITKGFSDTKCSDEIQEHFPQHFTHTNGHLYTTCLLLQQLNITSTDRPPEGKH